MTHEKNDLLEELRKDIDEIDREICGLIAERAGVSAEIGRVKRISGYPVENLQRETELLKTARAAHPEAAGTVEKVLRTLIEDSKRIQRSNLNLYFVGMPNCGKTKLAARLALALKRASVDMDALVMNSEGHSIDYIFDTYGEKYFRELENRALIQVARQGSLVVATGGGILTYEPNIPILRSSGVVVFLDRSPDGLVNAKVRNRPLIRGGAEDILRLYNERIDQYRANADLCVDPDKPDSVKRIAEFFRSRTT